MKWITRLFVIAVLALGGCGGGGGGGSASVADTEPAPPAEPVPPVEPAPPVDPPATTSNQVRVYQLGDVVEFSGTLSTEAPSPATTAEVAVRVEFVDNTYNYEDKNVLGMQTTVTLIATGEQTVTTKHVWQEENGALLELTDVYGNYYMDSATNEYGIPSIPSPLIPYEQIECQCYSMLGGNTSGALTMGTRTILVGEAEEISTAMATFSVYPVSQDSEFTYTMSFDIYNRDDSVLIDEVSWVSPESGIVKIRGIYKRFSSNGKLISAETLDIEAVSTSF